jgi:ribonuclease HII
MKNNIDQEYRSKGYLYIVGIDEAGRGPLAGPVVASAVLLPPKYENPLIDDSKKITTKQREQLAREIKKHALSYKIVVIEPKVIDELNIYQATKKAFEDALNGINVPFDMVLTDAMKINTIHPYDPLIKGDARSLSIAAASILAKVTRDEIMLELDKKYPHYGFKDNKGYPTKKHLKALETYGPIKDVHRFSYKPVAKTQYQQLKLF